MTCMDQTAGWDVNARMGAFVTVSVDASAPQGGEDRTVRSLVGTVAIIFILIHFILSQWSERIFTSILLVSCTSFKMWMHLKSSSCTSYFFQQSNNLSSMTSFSSNCLSHVQTEPQRSWTCRVIWSGISTPTPRSIARPQETRCPVTTALSCESWTALCSR